MNNDKLLIERINKLENEINTINQFIDEQKDKNNHLTIIMISNDYDKLVLAFSLAVTAASLGMKVAIIFTFWGICALKDKNKKDANKSFIGKMMSFMLPANIEKTKLSKMHMFGMGTWMMKGLMKRNGMPSISELLQLAKALDIKLLACAPTIDVIGISKNELLDNVEAGGSATFLSESYLSGISWVI